MWILGSVAAKGVVDKERADVRMCRRRHVVEMLILFWRFNNWFWFTLLLFCKCLWMGRREIYRTKLQQKNHVEDSRKLRLVLSMGPVVEIGERQGTSL